MEKGRALGEKAGGEGEGEGRKRNWARKGGSKATRERKENDIRK